jgi:hypothetical protein
MVCFYASRTASSGPTCIEATRRSPAIPQDQRCRPTLDQFHHGAATAGLQCGQIHWLRARVDNVADPYLSGVYRWWHLTSPSPELLAAEADGWLDGPVTAASGTPAAATRAVLDIGCGLGSEVAHLSQAGWSAIGIDLSRTAIWQARQLHPAASDGCVFARADAWPCRSPAGHSRLSSIAAASTTSRLSGGPGTRPRRIECCGRAGGCCSAPV